MLCLAVAVLLVAVAPAAQSREGRIDAADRAARAVFEPWLGPLRTSRQSLIVDTAWPAAPLTMDIESQVAFEIARRYWRQQPPTVLMDGAARYLQSHAVARMFDLTVGRAGHNVDAVRLFGGAYVYQFQNLRFDGPAAGLGREDMVTPLSRAALAFASLERITSQPRLIGALRTVIEAGPNSDAELMRFLHEALGQDVAWLFDSALDSTKSMNYRIDSVKLEECSPTPCHRVQVVVAHDGNSAFRDVDIRVDFADGQAASLIWHGAERSHTAVFEGPSAPVRARIDPELVNLLDDNLLDQSREIGATTNAPIGKWIARWAVWLQDAMLTYSAVV